MQNYPEHPKSSKVIQIHDKLDLICVRFAINSISSDQTVLTKVKAEIWEHGNITKKMSDGSRKQKDDQTIRQVGNKPTLPA